MFRRYMMRFSFNFGLQSFSKLAGFEIAGCCLIGDYLLSSFSKETVKFSGNLGSQDSNKQRKEHLNVFLLKSPKVQSTTSLYATSILQELFLKTLKTNITYFQADIHCRKNLAFNRIQPKCQARQKIGSFRQIDRKNTVFPL